MKPGACSRLTPSPVGLGEERLTNHTHWTGRLWKAGKGAHPPKSKLKLVSFQLGTFFPRRRQQNIFF